ARSDERKASAGECDREKNWHDAGAAQQREGKVSAERSSGPVERVDIAGAGTAEIEHTDCKGDREHVERADHHEGSRQNEHYLPGRAASEQRESTAWTT